LQKDYTKIQAYFLQRKDNYNNWFSHLLLVDKQINKNIETAGLTQHKFLIIKKLRVSPAFNKHRIKGKPGIVFYPPLVFHFKNLNIS